MKQSISPNSRTDADSRRPHRWPWLLAAVAGLAVWFALSPARDPRAPASTLATGEVPSAPILATSSRSRAVSAPVPRGPEATAPEVVAAKLDQFVRDRRELVHELARRAGVNVPAEMEEFFELAEAGRWAEAEALYGGLSEGRNSGGLSPELNRLFPAMLETIGVHEAVRDWPAQALLDYGNTVLGALPPGAVYLGGTDPGRFIPTLLNETSEGERHVVLTQNALADLTYADYAGILYGDRLAPLTPDDSQRAFQEYVADAGRRLAHDRQFPDEPKQVRPGEDIQDPGDGRVQVGGQVAVMAINERLLKTLMEKNPGVPFVLEESSPLAGLYADAAPRGPLLELRAGEAQSPLTPESAAQSLDYWRGTTRDLLADPATSASPVARAAYAKLALGQAGLFDQHQFAGEAEQAFQLANQLAPGNPEAVMRYVGWLTEQQRFEDAIPVAEAALNRAPDNEEFGRLLAELKSRGKP